MSNAVADRFDYSEYEFKLRDRQWNRERQSGYVAHFRDCHKVLDLACGSGIFLELLAEHDIPALGVERNPAIVAWVKQHGWNIIERDVFAFLEQTTETYDGVFCSHFLEHLPFEQVLRFFELLTPRVSAAGTVVMVVPNPESIRMQLFGFWRDPEHVRFYHPELLEAVFRHFGFQVTHTNRKDSPLAITPPASPLFSHRSESSGQRPASRRNQLKDKVQAAYFQFLRLLRITPYPDLIAVEEHIRQQVEVQRETLVAWANKTNDAVNQMWAWPDDVCVVCRKIKT